MYPANLMVSVSGVRGRVGESLTPEIIARFAAGFGAWSAARARGNEPATIIIGRDSRVSGPMLHRAAVAGLQSVGCRVLAVGIAPTPTIQLAVEHHHAAGGLALTASHNPIEWNALKFIGSSGLFLQASEGMEMRAVVEGEIPRASWDQLGTIDRDQKAIERHIAAILALEYLDIEAIRKRRFRVALDCVRGAGGVIMPALFEQLGCEVVAINLETDGRFPREPEPVAENLGDLESLVSSSGADIGFAVDPDVDRLSLVSEQGRAIGEDYTLALAVRVVLARRPGVVVTNLSTSRIVDDLAASRGSRVVRAPVGEVNVAVRMREEKAPVGGEGNGGVILQDLHLGRDAPVAAALILQLLLDEGEPLSRIIERYPRYVIVKDKLDRPAGALDAAYAALREAFGDAEVDTQDGLRLSWQDRWLHVRPSGTEPIVRVIAEGRDEDQARHMIRVSRERLAALAG
ncbi:phosphoglucosamine mutase [soil metagenome]